MDYGTIKTPIRQTSVQNSSFDEFINSGSQNVSFPKFNMKQAMDKWKQALQIAEASNDLINMAKVYSNFSCIYRAQGMVQDALQYAQKAWLHTCYFIQTANELGLSSPWLKFAVKALELTDSMGDIKISHSSDIDPKAMDICKGPPIIMWLFSLMTNIGNVHFSLGDYESAIKTFDACSVLLSSVVEEFPPPFEIELFFKAAEPNASNVKLSSEVFPYKLSPFHKCAILAKARCLSHLGVSYGMLGDSTTNLQYQLCANQFLTNVSTSIPEIQSAASFGVRTTSNSAPSFRSEFINLQASINANLGSAMYAMGDAGKSVEWHERSAAVYLSARSKLRDDVKEVKLQALEETRQQGNLGALYLHLGTTLKLAEWNDCKEDIENEQEPENWKIPLDELDMLNRFGNMSGETCAKQPLQYSLKIFNHQVQKQKQTHDRLGMMINFMNMGILFLR
jgi:tetratricopeptide (TPR) repeat protein